MYGLVNQAVQGLVESRLGPSGWLRIREKAGVHQEVFLSMEPYDDAITYGLVGAASEVLELAPEEVLHAFGEYWVLETAKKNYAALMEAAGSTLPELLGNLDQLHSRVLLTFPNLRPPSFRVERIDSDKLRVYYYSEREGLEPFVLGLLTGLGKYFNVQVVAALDVAKAQDQNHSEFIVTYSDS